MKSVQLSAASRRRRGAWPGDGGDIAGRSEAREEGAYLFSPATAAAFGLAGRSGSWTGLPGQTDVVAVERQGGNTVVLTLRIGSKRRLTVERKLTQKFAKAMPWSRRAGPKGSWRPDRLTKSGNAMMWHTEDDRPMELD